MLIFLYKALQKYRVPINRFLYLNFIIIVSVSCEDIFEKDISNEKIIILAPCDSCEINSSDIVFLWELVDGAADYKIQIVSPCFEKAKTVIVDTVVNSEKIFLQVPNGDFEWRIKAQNSVFSTDFFLQSFKVDTVTVIVNNPETDEPDGGEEDDTDEEQNEDADDGMGDDEAEG